MKKLLLPLTLLLTCILASESAHIPFKRVMNDLDELVSSNNLGHQVQGSMATNLNCSSCTEANEADCTANQIPIQCSMGESCLTLATVSATLETSFTRSCFPEAARDLVCLAINQTSNFTTLLCAAEFCNTSLCNAGSPLPTTGAPSTAAPSTAAPTTAASTTSAPTTAAPTTSAPTTAAPTTSAPTTAAPTTAVVCGGALMGASGVFTTPFFPNNYPNNLNCVWTDTVARGRRLVLRFSAFALGAGDSLIISVGGRRLTVTERTLRRGDDDEPSYYDEFTNEGNGNLYRDYVNNRRFYYYYDARRKLDDDDGPFSSGNGQVVVQGSNRPISIQFSSDASGNAQGFSITFRDERSPDSSGESSDEEE